MSTSNDVYIGKHSGNEYRVWQWIGSNSNNSDIPDWLLKATKDIIRTHDDEIRLVPKDGIPINVPLNNYVTLGHNGTLFSIDGKELGYLMFPKQLEKLDTCNADEYANPTTKDLYKLIGSNPSYIVRAYKYLYIDELTQIPRWIRARVDKLEKDISSNPKLKIVSDQDGTLIVEPNYWVVLYPDTNRLAVCPNFNDLYEPYRGLEELYYHQKGKCSNIMDMTQAQEPLMPCSTVRVGGTFEEYSEFVKRFANSNIPFLGVHANHGPADLTVSELLHACIGMSTEANEMLTTLKKHLFYNAALDVVNMKEELGDLMWFAAQCMRYFGWTLEEILDANKQKLVTRYGDGYNDYSANNRDLTKEREGLQWSYDNMKGSHFVEPGHTLKMGDKDAS